VLLDGRADCRVFREDANRILVDGSLREVCFDLVYLDPPYNQHQYGSNYHLLNTITLWDKPDVARRSAGRDKAGIRKDWVKTRSPYCYRDSAGTALGELLDSVDCRWILVSYSNGGIIPFEELVELCSARGRVRVLTNEYVAYRGGRQSLGRRNDTVETLLCVDTSVKSRPRDLDGVWETMTDRTLTLQVRKKYVRKILAEEFFLDEEGERIGMRVDGRVLWLQTRAFFQIAEEGLPGSIERAFPTGAGSRRLKEELSVKLKRAECADRAQEMGEILRILRDSRSDVHNFIVLVPQILRKIAHKKYRELFFLYLGRVRELGAHRPSLYARIAHLVDEVEALARKRFSG
jgi:adenine-specific DNA-methyltransferase